MLQLKLPLSDEPPLGTWSIKAIINDVTTTQEFDVEKYVLPKFEVKIKPPAYVMGDAETITFEVCAWYSYGKKVDGKLKAKVTYRTTDDDKKAIPSVEHSGLISGCHTFSINTQDIMLRSGKFRKHQIEVFAEVIENGTEIIANATFLLTVKRSPLTMEFLGTQETEYFKPGIPFYGQLQVLKPDGEPAPSEKIEICAYFSRIAYRDSVRKCSMFTTNKMGRVRFVVPPQALQQPDASPTTEISLMAEAVNYHDQHFDSVRLMMIHRPKATLILKPWYSPSNNYLQIQPTPDEMECEKLHRVKIRYTGERGASIKFYHKVISRGRIVQQGSHQRTFYAKDDSDRSYDFNERTSSPLIRTLKTEPNLNETAPWELGEFDLSFDPRATMSPVARLLIYYVRDDGEVVADSRKFQISKCLLNKVNLHFRHEQQYPSTEASLLLSASPSSVCGIGMVDKSIRFLKPENQFKIDKIFDIIEGYDVDKKTKPLQVSDDYCLKKGNEPAINQKVSSTTPSRLHLYRLVSRHADTSMAFEEAGMVVITDFELDTRPCGVTEPIAIPYRSRSSGAYRKKPVPVSARALSPPEEIPKEPQAQTESQVEEIRSFFPETWLWEMHAVGLSGEMAIRRQLPHTITQWVGRAVCVHPKTGLGVSEESSVTAFQPFFVEFRLPYAVVRGEVLPLVVTVFNYLTECLPIRLSLEPSEEYKILSEARSHKLCVCGAESGFHKFILKPTTLGLVNVTVYGFSHEDDDEVCGNEITARLSARDAVSKQLLVEAEGFPKEEVYNFYMCPKNTNGSYATEVDLIPPENVVEGSARAFVSVSGDLMAPALHGLQGLVKLPKGCGEQNMILFTPNIFVLDYLTATGRKTPEMEENCVNNMKTGYQRELLYRLKDGSYSAFGSRDKEGSLWLTAFVLKSFGQARRFIDIDEQDLRLSINWVLENQFENGCFRPTGTVYHKEMRGGLDSMEHSLAPLTAYVLITLIESGVVQNNQEEVQNALRCLAEDSNPSTYAVSLYAYACALTKQTVLAQNYLQLLDDSAVNRGGARYWDSIRITSQDKTLPKSVSVEIAGYYVLAQMEMKDQESTEKVLSTVRWMAKQRNSDGGFISTQDTIVALQALARYASSQSQEAVDMGVVVESDGLVKGFKLNEDNKLVTQSVQIPELPAVVDLQAVGDGCALVQFSFRYNVEGIEGSDAFDLNIDVVRQGSLDCNLPRIGICMRYKVLNETSNMVVVFVKMASGFMPDEGSLNELQSDSSVGLKRYEVDGNQVNLYFDELTNEQKCFKFNVKNEMEVEDIKPSSVKICDYYQPELQVTKEYTIPSSCTIPELPELPRLPPLIVNEDGKFKDRNMDDIDLSFDTQSPIEDAEKYTEFIETPHFTTEYNEIDGRSFGSAKSTQTSGFLVGETTEVLGHSKDMQTTEYVTNVEQDTTVSSVEVPDTNIEPYTATSHGKTEDLVTIQLDNAAGTIAEEALADDANTFWVDTNLSRFSKFINIEHDLDVPDGIEGNFPVSVLPPINDWTSIAPDEPITLDCPVCSDEFSDEFPNIYCSSSYVLRVIVRDMSGKSVKILQDISSFYELPKSIKKFATLEYDERCRCLPLHKRGNILLIAGVDRTTWNSQKGKHHIHLKQETNIILISSKALQPIELKRAKSTCTDDP